MTETKTITGVDAAIVYVMQQLGEKKQPVAMRLDRGAELPANLREGELERLEKLGAFEDRTKAEQVRANQRAAAAMQAASAAERLAADAESAIAASPGAKAKGALAAQTTYDNLKVDEAIEFIEGLPETERDSYFEAERAKGRKSVLEHFDQPTE